MSRAGSSMVVAFIWRAHAEPILLLAVSWLVGVILPFIGSGGAGFCAVRKCDVGERRRDRMGWGDWSEIEQLGDFAWR